jgi:hypothetical protein
MRRAKVVESVDIEAPQEEVFDVIANCDRRFQLSPLWGVAQVEDITPDFPNEGSSYHSKILVEGHETEYDAIVTAFVPNQKFAYRLTSRRKPHITWTVQDVSRGTRIIYNEEFLVDEDGAEHFVQTVRQIMDERLSPIGWVIRVISKKRSTPFLSVSSHIGDAIRAVTLRRETVDRDDPGQFVFTAVAQSCLPLVPPRIQPAISATGCLLPLRFGWQAHWQGR